MRYVEKACDVCGGRPSACLVLGHRPESDRTEWRTPAGPTESELKAKIEARIEMCEELTDFLESHTSEKGFLAFFGLIGWWRVNRLLRKWVSENNELLAKIRSS